jgi:hypothetical protein
MRAATATEWQRSSASTERWIDVTAIAADGRRFPLSLHSGSPGPLGAIALYDNQLRLKIPAKLRHPHGH